MWGSSRARSTGTAGDPRVHDERVRERPRARLWPPAKTPWAPAMVITLPRSIGERETSATRTAGTLPGAEHRGRLPRAGSSLGSLDEARTRIQGTPGAGGRGAGARLHPVRRRALAAGGGELGHHLLPELPLDLAATPASTPRRNAPFPPVAADRLSPPNARTCATCTIRRSPGSSRRRAQRMGPLTARNRPCEPRWRLITGSCAHSAAVASARRRAVRW